MNKQINDLDKQIRALMVPLAPQIAQLDTIPGLNVTAAREVLAEIGTDI